MLIRTKRLTLRPMEETDLDRVVEMITDNTIKRTYMVPDFASREEAARLARRFITLAHDDSRVVVGIAYGDTLIGFINDVGIEDGELELGYALHPACHGQGYMTEAVSALIPALFVRGFTRVIASAFEENAASMRVMEKCGMCRIEKTEQVEYRGKTHDCVYYAIEKTEEAR